MDDPKFPYGAFVSDKVQRERQAEQAKEKARLKAARFWRKRKRKVKYDLL